MDKLYLLYGKVMHEFQKLETYLYLLIFCNYEKTAKKLTRKEFLKILERTEKTTMGGRLTELKNLKVFVAENDITVLDYLKKNRNRLAHIFFIEKEFETEQDVFNKEKELSELLSHTILINKALSKMIIGQEKQNKEKLK